MPLARHLTIRNVAPDLSRAIQEERRRRGASVNRTVLDLLRRALGLASGRTHDNGLAKLAGGWTTADLRRFERDTAFLEQIAALAQREGAALLTADRHFEEFKTITVRVLDPIA